MYKCLVLSLIIFIKGSLIGMCGLWAPSTNFTVYRWNRREEMVLVISLYKPLPELRPFEPHVPLLKNVSTSSTYFGVGLKTPYYCMKQVDRNGYVLSW